MTTTTAADHMAEAAGLVLAEMQGDSEAKTLLIKSMIEARDFRGAILMMSSALSVASLAIGAEATKAKENGEGSTASVDLLVAMTRLNRGGMSDGQPEA